MSNNYPLEIIEKALLMYQEKIPTKLIAEKLNITKDTILYHVRKNSIAINRLGKLSPEHKECIIKLYKENFTIVDIARQLNLNRNTVAKFLKRENISEDNFKRHLEIIESQKPLYFEDLDNADTQYWLGFLASDGYVTSKKNSFGFTTKDLEIAEGFCSYLKTPTSVIEKYFDNRYNKSYYQVLLNNKKTVSKLISYGITPNKSLTLSLKIPITYPMFTGILDGDGTVNDSIIIYTASNTFKDQLVEFLSIDFACSSYLNLSSSNPVWSVRILKKDCDLEKLKHLMYKDLTFYLQRKKLKVDSI
jgi:DNA-binding CsgD family transcriptional regulator